MINSHEEIKGQEVKKIITKNRAALNGALIFPIGFLLILAFSVADDGSTSNLYPWRWEVLTYIITTMFFMMTNGEKWVYVLASPLLFLLLPLWLMVIFG